MEHSCDDLFAQYPAIIAQMPSTFNSHQFIQRLTQQHQQLYIDALYAHRDSHAPFQVVHKDLAQHLNQLPELVIHDGEVHSINIFGQSNGCVQWRRL